MLGTTRRIASPDRGCVLAALCTLLSAGLPATAAQVVLSGPIGSGEFGRHVYVMPNGNLLVTDPIFDGIGSQVDIGAVRLYRPNGVLVHTLRGAQAGDRVGSGGVTVLDNGHYVVRSPNWQNGAIANAGAATWRDGNAASDAVVDATNSLIGSSADDHVGARVEALRNGNYVVVSSQWDRGAILDAGAVTLGSGVGGLAGTITPQNSLVGSQPFDGVGSQFQSLENGNYVVGSPNWNRGSVNNSGAATFGSGSNGVVGEITVTQSLLGTSDNDRVGEVIHALATGAYVVSSFNWNNGAEIAAGAATFGSGTQGAIGTVSATNSLVGSVAFSAVGKAGIVALTNGNYVVQSPEWNDGSGANVGAATFGSGTVGVAGVVSSANSLVGRVPGDAVGMQVVPLADGNYVVVSPMWNEGMSVDVGAVTFGNGEAGVSGFVVPANSFSGARSNDSVGSAGVVALVDGNFVIMSPGWDDPPLGNVGAATFVDVSLSTIGVVSAANSLIGASANDGVGANVAALPDGGYVVGSPAWNHGVITDAGAATRSDAGGITGVVSFVNSLVGTTANDRVPSDIGVLSTGDFVLRSSSWTNLTIPRAGAVTFWRASDPLVGTVNPGNSMVGSTAMDRIGDLEVITFANGNYLTGTRSYDDDEGFADAGALSLGLRDGRVIGRVTSEHSVIGSIPNSVDSWSYVYDEARNQLAVGQPLQNQVTLHRSGSATTISITGDSPDPSIEGDIVSFTAVVGASATPDEGVVTFRSSTGATCTDATPVSLGSGMAEFGCTLRFDAAGTVEVIAEYTGSLDFGYSGSALETHQTRGVDVFGDGFESP